MTSKDLFEFLSGSDELSDYEIGEDNEGQLLIYTGLYRVPRANDGDEDLWVKVPVNPVPHGARAE